MSKGFKMWGKVVLISLIIAVLYLIFLKIKPIQYSKGEPFGIIELRELNITYENQPKIINFTGTVWSDGYTFYFIENCTQTYLERYNRTSNCAGFTEENNLIWLQTNYPDHIIWKNCNHEVLHNLIKMENGTLEEEIVEILDSQINLDVCNKVMEILKP